MSNDKNIDSQGDSAPPAAFIQTKDFFDNNNNKTKLEETKYPFLNDNFMNNSNGIIQNKINSFQSNEDKTPQNLSSPTHHQGNSTNEMMSLNKLNTFNQENSTSNNKNKNQNESIINSKIGEYFDDIIIISEKKKIFYCINHNKGFKFKNGLISHCKRMHKFRCGKCGIFFEEEKKKIEHYIFCKKIKNKFSKFDFDDIESKPNHFSEIYDKKNQNSNEKKNISQKIKLNEDCDINIKDNEYEKPPIEKYKNQDEKVELKNDEDIFEKILLKSKENMDKEKALKLKKHLRLQKKLKKNLKRKEELKRKKDLQKQNKNLKKKKIQKRKKM